MATLPLSVYLTDRIHLQDRARESTHTQDVDAEKLQAQLRSAATTQAKLGLGNPKGALALHETSVKNTKLVAQAEKLAFWFRSVKPPIESMVPRFAGTGEIVGPTKRNATELPKIAMVKLHAKLSGLNMTIAGQYYEANLPLMPSTVLELAERAQELAPDAEFHLVFLPEWEKRPQRDPILLAHIPGTEDYFEVGAWGGDESLIREFMEDIKE